MMVGRSNKRKNVYQNFEEGLFEEAIVKMMEVGSLIRVEPYCINFCDCEVIPMLPASN